MTVSGCRVPLYDGCSSKPSQEKGTGDSLGSGVGPGRGPDVGGADEVEVVSIPSPHAQTPIATQSATTPAALVGGLHVIRAEMTIGLASAARCKRLTRRPSRPPVRRTLRISCEAPSLAPASSAASARYPASRSAPALCFLRASCVMLSVTSTCPVPDGSDSLDNNRRPAHCHRAWPSFRLRRKCFDKAALWTAIHCYAVHLSHRFQARRKHMDLLVVGERPFEPHEVTTAF